MNLAQMEQRQIQLAKSGGVCEVCGKTLTPSTWQGAHRIANTKANRAKCHLDVVALDWTNVSTVHDV